MQRFLPILIAVLMVASSVVSGAEPAYPRPDVLVEPASLGKALDAERLIVLDLRDRTKYEQGHVPVALRVDPAVWAKAFGKGEDAEGWSKRIGEIGVGADSRIVVYDDNYSKDAARVWWILHYWGVEHVRVLNGGWTGWTAAGQPVEKTERKPSPVAFAAKAKPERLATKDQILKSLSGGTLQIVDARSEKEYCGEEKGNNKKAGAIPGAKQLEWIDLIDKETQRFKPAPELRKLLDEAGISLDRPTATHCQGGGRAAVVALGLELMGAKDVSNYYLSWAEWGNADDTPVVPGKPKAKK